MNYQTSLVIAHFSYRWAFLFTLKLKKMDIVQFLLAKKHLPIFRKAAKDFGLEVNASDNTDKDGLCTATVIVRDYSDLIYLGFSAGMDVACTSMKNDMLSVQNVLEKIISSVNSSDNDKSDN